MKRLADLTLEDLTSAPVWRYEGGDGVDAVVVEQARDGLSQMDEEIFLAATEFLLPDSSQHLGFCFPVDDAGLDYLQPAIVTLSGHVQFWFDGAVPAEVLSAQWAALGKRVEEVFPVRFRCCVPVDGREVTGVIPGIKTSADIVPTHPAEFVAGDISRNGMFVRSARPPNGGPAVSLTVHLPGGREILMMGRVVRSASAS